MLIICILYTQNGFIKIEAIMVYIFYSLRDASFNWAQGIQRSMRYKSAKYRVLKIYLYS